MKKVIFISSFLVLVSVFACSQKSEVKKLKSGLTYIDNKVGDGAEAKAHELVTIHFTGWVVKDSTNLYGDWSNDSTQAINKIADSRAMGKEIKFVLGEKSFINGADEGIEGMKVGGVRTIVIPYNLAYGEAGMGPIPPKTDIKLQVELLKVQDKIDVKMWDVDPSKLKTTKSGLKYAIIKEGEGDNIKKGNVVTVNYSGFLEDGTKFDSSVERDEPFSFVAGMKQVIPGWDEGVTLAKKGTKIRLVVPPNLAYGNMKVGAIPPNSTLIFDIEILDVK